MSLDIQTHNPAADALATEAVSPDRKLQWMETALLAGAVGIGVVLVSILSVLLHLS